MAEKLTPNGLVVGLIPDDAPEISAPTMDKASETSEQAAEVAITPPIAPVKNKGGRPPKKSAN